jgi:hypothetical protein
LSITLPYEFDTSGVVTVILRGVLGLLLVVVVLGIPYSLFISQNMAGALGLLVVAALAAYFGRLFLENLQGSQGTITADAVVVRPGRLYGIRLAGPEGRFPIRQFKAVRVERVLVQPDAQTQPHERVSLVGQGGTPDILVARAEVDAGKIMGEELARLLHLPFEEERAPY